ncbi:uncharacterized protein LOC129598822 [Paramacrobiotus metropolitanus]|uniref:uncharacterized protein LOC129598822 n=1 Tax=Paramacrobiotus metropolitanus TaxID=2943436 RepID=UPI002445D4F3|nr:uncharacterized protein LOC129598822 [Paramacrobiotus metropolitanus]
MSNLHYKKDGSLDMRYSSSRAAAASSSSSSTAYPSSSISAPSPSFTSTNPSSSTAYPSSSVSAPSPSFSSNISMPSYRESSASSDLHYKKDGSLDMRYTSSRAASTEPSVARAVPTASTASSDLHYKKDGTLDMRYNSSQQAASVSSPVAAAPAERDDRHYKKDGSLDMRYTSSKLASVAKDRNGGLHYKKDGTPDMRYTSSKQAANNNHSAGSQPNAALVPEKLHYKKDGTLDMRYKSSRNAQQEVDNYNAHAREEYLENLMQEAALRRLWQQQQAEVIQIPRQPEYITPEHLATIRQQYTQLERGDIDSIRLDDAREIPYTALKITGKKLGSGAFGDVVLAEWGSMQVALKTLRPEAQPNRRERQLFIREIAILAQLGKHPNLVAFHGYCLDPLSIVMEYVELGNLHNLLHICVDRQVELKIADGRIKKNIIIGIVDGMKALHDAGIVHGDLKPQNVLVDRKYQAKITDFGLANLRYKASSVVHTEKSQDYEIIGGTAAYMAPESMDSTKESNFSQPKFSSDVYAFGIVLNELATEEEPYADQYRNFAGHGPFAAVKFAQQGRRPRIGEKVRADLVALIKSCWDAKPERRPTFASIQETVRGNRFQMPNGPGLN